MTRSSVSRRGLWRSFCLPLLVLSAALGVALLSAAALAVAGEEDFRPLVITGTDGRSHTFSVEVADTPGLREKGLMERVSLPADKGMIFLFGRPRLVRMWMKNTLISLDILFINSEGKVLSVERAVEPEDLTPRGPDEQVGTVVELAGGTCDRLSIGEGSVVDLSRVVRAGSR